MGRIRAEEVKQAEAEVRQARAERDYEENRTERMRALARLKSIRSRLVDEAEAKLKEAQAKEQQMASKHKLLQETSTKDHLAVLKAELARAEAECALCKLHLDGTDLLAPVSGTLLARHVEVGDFVGPVVCTGCRASVCDIADLAQLEAVVELPERLVNQVNPGQKCLIRVDAVPNVVYNGVVSRIKPTVSQQTRTVTARIRVEALHQARNLRPGMYGQVDILARD
jgi:HlyD family secretion protein